MKEKWLTTREAATALKISCRAVKKNAAKGKYTTKLEKTPKGQQGYLIALSSLPVPAAKPAAPAPAKADIMTSCDDRQRAEAFRRLEILQQWKSYVEHSEESASHATETYLRLGLNGEISRSTLYRWDRDYDANGLLGLIPNWSNGKDEFSNETFHPEAKRLAQQLWLQTSRISYAAVYKTLQKKALIEGWALPSYATATRFLRSIPAPARILLREGRKACEDNAVPSILRTLDGLQAMEIIESDHHQLDVAVIDRDGKVFFPWLTIWFDVRARRPLGWILSSTPNADGINLALYKTIREFGVPREVHIDNGKDYRAKIFRGEQGRFKAEKTDVKVDLKPSLIDGIYGMLGITVHWAIPYNAKSKVIERFFRTLRTEFSVWFRGYRGKNTMEKPEILAKQWRQGDVFPFDAMKMALQKWIDVEYCQQRPHKGLEARTPDQVFAETRIEKRMVSEEELIWLCSQYPRRLKVSKNGIYLFNDYYWSEKLACEHLGEYVLVRYAEDDLNRIFVMNEQGRFIGMADKRNLGSWKMDAEEYRKHMRMKKTVKESIMPYADISKQLTPADREKLFLGLIQDDGSMLPAAPERRVNTPFRMILEEEKRQREEAKELDAGAQEFLHQLATDDSRGPESERERIDRRLDEFFDGYYRR
jgi:transposase InsO family protein